MKPLDVTIIGGGMITYDLLLPSFYHLQRTGQVGAINICALNNPPLKALAENSDFAMSFPGQSFEAYPPLTEAPDRNFPTLYREVLAAAPKRQITVVAMPDQLHYEVVMEALKNDQHVLCVKPLVLKHEQAEEIRDFALERGLFVGVEYHKRFDRRSLIARRSRELGQLGDFVMGEAKLVEPYYYRDSNFQNWFTVEKTDPFVYVGCHYVDLVYFITGLKPVEVSVAGVKGKFPNGNEGFLWSGGRVRFENGGLLSVLNGLGYPDDAAGSNDQGMVLYFEGERKTGMIQHDDQYRGVALSYLSGLGPGGTAYNYVNPDFFKMVPWEGPGYKPVGYGYDSVAAIAGAITRLEQACENMPEDRALVERRRLIRETDEKGLIATPANSAINELVVEAARASILRDGMPVSIIYDGKPHVAPRT